MSNTKVTVEFNLADKGNSIEKSNNNAKALNKTLEKTQQLATGTRTGAGAVKASLGPSMPGEGTSYGQARGSMGATGAAGRDFANQAQGLGGLVRLYATYAANVFAVSAAFTALSQAMNTTNMVQGLNQLGAASGVSLGNLAKQFTEASGGAISLRESMESTAKAISAGLSQTQFIKLGEVAKQASQALGINMSDAVSRLTRGIVKLEPELLDELGIFTKIGPATEDYARQVGKAASQLTDFERRQAFANAVLAEGQKKFSEIDIPTNPYDKLLASLKNTAQSILEVINVALVPLVNILSSSPGALLAAIAAIGIKITTQALPAITQYREGLKQAAQDAQKLADLRSVAATEAYNKAAEPAMQRQLEQRAEAYLKKEEALNKLVEKSTRASESGRLVKDFREIMATKDVTLIKDEDIAKIENHGKSLRRNVNIYTEWAKAAADAKIGALAFDKELAKVPDVTKAALGSSVDIALRKKAAADRQALTRSIVSQASIDTEVEGARAAFTKMTQSLDVGKLGVARAAFTALSSTLSIVTTKALGLAAAFGNIFAVVGIIVTAYQMFTSIFGKNAKEAERSKNSLDALEGSIDSVTATIDRLNKLPILESLTPNALAAKGTALSNLSVSLSQALDDVEKEIQNRNVVDSISNWVSGLIGTNTEERITQQLVDAIDGAFKAASTVGQADSTRKYLALALNLPVDASLDAVKKAAKKASPAIQKELSGVIESIAKKAQSSSGSVKAFVDGLSESAKVSQTLANSFKASDPLSNFLDESSKQIIEFSKVLDSADLPGKLALLTAGATDTRFLQLLPIENAKELLATASSLKQANDELANGLVNIRALEDGRLQTQQKLDSIVANSPYAPILRDAITKYDTLIAKAREYQKTIEENVRSKLVGLEETFQKSLGAALLRNIEQFQAGLTAAAQKARLEIEKTNLQGIVDPRARIAAERDIELRSIKLEEDTLRSQVALIQANDNLRLAIMEQTYVDKLASSMAKTGAKDELSARVQDTELDRASRTLEVAKAIPGKTLGELSNMLKTANTPDVRAAVQAALPGAQAIASAQQRAAESRGRAENIKLSAEFKFVDAEMNAAKAQYDKMLKDLEFRKPELSATEYEAQRAGISQGQAMLIPAADIRKASISQDQAMLNPVAKGSIEQLRKSSENMATAKANLENARLTTDQVTSRALASAEEVENLTKASAIYKQYFADQTLGLQQQDDTLQLKQAQLAQDLERGKISQDEFNAVKYIYDTEQAGITRANALLAEQEKYTKTILDIRTKIAQAGGESPEQSQALQQAVIDTNAATAAINRQYDQTLKLRDLNKDLAERQQAYADLFTQAFRGMEDAIVEFTRTGKLSFSSMIESFIEGLLRYELQQQQMALLKGVGGAGGLAGLAVDFVKYGAGMGNTGSMTGTGPLASAKGNAFDYGVQAFAKGGAFTNQIVDSPTLFKFARGTGLMGEAGPEAIMPLKRDSNGNLGVRGPSGAGNVEVVVNNYSTAQAETRETTDSRGNRRIEVIVGDMVAQEVAKTGSATQNAFSSTYGTRPALARR
jgi:lambda family phage tail tape measure protein